MSNTYINQNSNKTSVILQDGVIFKSFAEKGFCLEGRIESFSVIYRITGKKVKRKSDGGKRLDRVVVHIIFNLTLILPSLPTILLFDLLTDE